MTDHITPSSQDAEVLYNMIKRYSADGKRSVTIPNGDIPTLLRCLHLLKIRDRQAILSREHWVRAAKKAIEGDMRELRNRVALAEAGPVEIVLSQ